MHESLSLDLRDWYELAEDSYCGFQVSLSGNKVQMNASKSRKVHQVIKWCIIKLWKISLDLLEHLQEVFIIRERQMLILPNSLIMALYNPLSLFFRLIWWALYYVHRIILINKINENRWYTHDLSLYDNMKLIYLI